MPAKPPKAFDVWLMAANTVYKAVPYNVVADWTQQGRLGRADKVRPAGTTEPWVAVGDHELLTDYLPRPSGARAVSATPVVAAVVVPDEPIPSTPPYGPQVAKPRPGTDGGAATVEGPDVELPDPEPPTRVSRPEDDDEVDMIPLIDISMVLLVFFIMIQAAGALAPVDVPEMRYAGSLTTDPQAVTITIDKKNTDEVFYSVRVGSAPAAPEDDQLPTPDAAILALRKELDARAKRGDKAAPPEVRIACHKELPRERVYELRRMLDTERAQGRITSFVATVVEASEK